MNKLLAISLALAACNNVYLKPGTLDKNQTVYANRGGYSMKRAIKENMETRGFKVIVGKSAGSRDIDLGDTDFEGIDMDVSDIMNARYVVKVSERTETFMPYWCPFNGFWWWRFNVSIADQKTGEELLAWRGRGCANSSLRKLDRILDELEK